MKTRQLLFLAAFLLLTASGCGSSLKKQALADYDRQVRSFKTIGVVTPDILMLELSAGGVQEQIDEWRVTAVQNLSQSLQKELDARAVRFRTIAPGRDADFEDIQYLNRAISESLNWNTTYRKLSVCADERICRDYSVGPIQNILRRHNVDALLLVYGVNELETNNRAAARRRSRAASFWIGAVAPVTFAPLRNPGTYLSMALIDQSGAVLWYSGTATGKGYDLRNGAVVEGLTKRILSRMWIERRE